MIEDHKNNLRTISIFHLNNWKKKQLHWSCFCEAFVQNLNIEETQKPISVHRVQSSMFQKIFHYKRSHSCKQEHLRCRYSTAELMWDLVKQKDLKRLEHLEGEDGQACAFFTCAFLVWSWSVLDGTIWDQMGPRSTLRYPEVPQSTKKYLKVPRSTSK